MPKMTPLFEALPLRERPAYRVAYHADQASLFELLSTLVGGCDQFEIAEHLVQACQGNLLRLATMPVEELENVPGIGRQTALRIKSAVQLGKRLMIPKKEKRAIQSPGDIAQLLLPEMCGLEQEELWVIALNTRNHILKIEHVYRGSVNSTQVRVSEILRPAVHLNAPALIIAHNHPSGDPEPSSDDINLTRTMVKAGKMMDISVLDHLVIGHNRFVSLKERGMGFN